MRDSAIESPRVERVSAKIATIERRIEWLTSRIKDFEANGQGADRRLNFDRAEAEALTAAVGVMKYHRATMDPESDPVLVLSEIYSVIDETIDAGAYHPERLDEDDLRRLDAAMSRARRVLAELED